MLKIITVLCLTFVTFCNFLYSAHNPRVVVIGSGIAGLTAAYRLKEKKFDVQVYEAKNRVRGRIFTALIDGHVTELGAQNILNGGAAENLLSLIEELKLQLQKTTIDISTYFIDQGQAIYIKELLKKFFFTEMDYLEYLEEIAKNSQNMHEVLMKIFGQNDILYKTFSLMLSTYEGGKIEQLSPIYFITLYHMISGGLCEVHPSSGEDESLLDIMSIYGGLNTLTEKMAEKMRDCIHLNQPLKAISKNLDGSYLLTFDSEEE